jgi:hypothetical protein
MEPHGAPASGWHAEMHQFRIGAEAMPVGKPTPEGVHRDGVDWVFVALINRQNICNGATRIFDIADEPLDEFTLERPLDAVFLNDRRVRHDVTPLIADNPAEIALRDVLVLTFRADAALPSRQKI